MGGSPRAELLRLIADAKEHPDEDMRRYRIADWLGQQGNERDSARAEMIRAQCQLAQSEPDDLECVRFVVERLWEAFWTKWPKGPPHLQCSQLSRGMIRYEIQSPEHLAIAESLFATEDFSWVDGLKVAQLDEPHLVQFFRSQILERLTTLSISGCQLTSASINELFSSPNASHLVELTLQDNKFDEASLQRIAHSTCRRTSRN